MSGNNEKPEQIKFKWFITVGLNEDGSFAIQTNVPNLVKGYGMCELGKKGVDNHIAQLKKKSIITPRVI